VSSFLGTDEEADLLYSIPALLVGKLQMNASEAIEACMKLEPVLSFRPTEDEEERIHNSEAFKKAFTEILEENGFDENSLMESKEQNSDDAKM
jgi:hypothetical protein